MLAATATYDLTRRVWLTYVLYNPETGQVYIGRTSGYGDPYRLARERYYRHTQLRSEGFVLDRVDNYAYGPVGYDAVRGREQQLVDALGGIGAAVL